MPFRIGFGIDFHQLVTGREFWIGGVQLSHIKERLGIVMQMYCFMQYAMHCLVRHASEILVFIFPILQKNLKILIVKYFCKKLSGLLRKRVIELEILILQFVLKNLK